MLKVGANPDIKTATKMGETFYDSKPITPKLTGDHVGEQVHTIDIWKANFKDDRDRYIYFWDIAHWAHDISGIGINPHVVLWSRLEFENEFDILEMDPQFGNKLTGGGSTTLSVGYTSPQGVSAGIQRTIPTIVGSVTIKKPTSRDENFYELKTDEDLGHLSGTEALVATASHRDLEGEIQGREIPPYINWMTGGEVYSKTI